MPRKKEVFGVDVNGDITGLKRAMNEASAVLRSTERAINQVNKAIKSDPNDIKLLKEQAELYAKAMRESTEEVKKFKDMQDFLRSQKGFKDGITDQSEEFKTITARLKEATAKEKEFAKALRETELKISNFTFDQKMRKVSEELLKSKKNIDDVNASLSAVERQLQFNPDSIDLYNKKQDLLKEKVRALTVELDNLEKKRKLLSDTRFRIVSDDEKKELDETEADIREVTEAIISLNGQIEKSNTKTFAQQIEELGNAFGEMADRTRVFSRTFQTLFSNAFKSSVDFESSIAGIQKVVKDLSTDTVADLKRIAIDTGNAFDEIASYATIGGALGLAEKDLSSFTKAMVDLNTVSGGAFSGEEGAKGIAVFLNQLGLSIDQAENFGSAIAVIGDKYADIGDETVNVATRLTGLNSIIKTNQYELIGLAGVMADLGLASDSNANGINRAFIQIDKVLSGGVKNADIKLKEMAETAGMASEEFREAWGQNAVDTFLKFTDGLKSSVFNEINDAISSSSKKVEDYAAVLGVSAEQFAKMWGSDSRKVFDQYINSLEGLDDEGVVASKILSDLGISSVNTAQTLLRLAGSGNEVRDAIKLTEEAWTENTALMEKSSIIYDTTERKIEAFKESWRQLSSSFTDLVLPAVKDVIDSLNEMMKRLSDSSGTTKQFVLAFAGLGAGLSPAFRVFQKFFNVISMFTEKTEEVELFSEALGETIKVTRKAPSGFEQLAKVLTSPTGVSFGIALITTALIGGTVALGKYLDKTENATTPLRKLKDNILSVSKAFNESATTTSNDLIALDYSIYKETSTIQDQIKAVETLAQKLKDGQLTDEETKETKEELAQKIKELNSQLGTSYYYDSKQKEILDENKDVADLISSYEKLVLEKRKAYYMEAYEGEYNQAITDQAKALETIAEAKWEYAKATEGYDKELIAFAEHFATNAMDVDTQEIFQSLDQNSKNAVITIADLYLKAKDTVSASQDLLRNTDSIIHNYESIASLEGADLEKALDALKNGWNIDPAKNDLEELYKELEKVQYLLANPEGLSNDQLKSFESFEKEIEDQIELVERAQSKASELHDKNGKVFDEIGQGLEGMKTKNNSIYNADSDSIIGTSEIAWDSISTKIVESTTSALDDYKTKVEETNQEVVDFVDKHPIYQDIYIRTKKATGRSGSYSQLNSAGYQSGGFGGLAEAVRESIRNSVANINARPIASGGYMSNITLNNSFTISNGANITKEVVESWADVMTDRINENLGRLV